MALLPPSPIGQPPGNSFWNDWYEKLRSIVNTGAISIAWNNITGRPTTLAGYGITNGAALNGSNRITVGVDTTDDVIVDLATKGLVLRSPNGDYWRATISNGGVVTWTNLGAVKP